MQDPFASARNIAETLTDRRIQSQLLSELARQQLATAQFGAALQTFAAIPDMQERRVALLIADFQAFPPEYVESLVELLESHPLTHSLAGRIALTMLEANNTATAWKLVDTAHDPFEFDQMRYEFLVAALPLLPADEWHRIPRFSRTFAQYRDWASLAIAKHLAGRGQLEEAERYIEQLASPLRRSRAYWEINQTDKAIEIANDISIVANDMEAMEGLAIQLRIYGRAQRDERLLERSEGAISVITMPMTRYRLQCFLGKVLVDLRLIDSIGEYLAIDQMLTSLSSGIDRSRVSVWLAEAGWNAGWTQAVGVLAEPERSVAEWERAEQIGNVLRRFVAHHQHLQPTGDPLEDAVRLSGEAFEAFHFHPFAEEDCGC